MVELANALPQSGANYLYLLNGSTSKLLAVTGAVLTLLDDVLCAVVSAATASSYIAHQGHLPFPDAYLTVIILGGIGLTCMSGVKLMARATSALLAFHVSRFISDSLARSCSLSFAAGVHACTLCGGRGPVEQVRERRPQGELGHGTARGCREGRQEHLSGRLHRISWGDRVRPFDFSRYEANDFNTFFFLMNPADSKVGLLPAISLESSLLTRLPSVAAAPDYKSQIREGLFPSVLRNLQIITIAVNAPVLLVTYAVLPSSQIVGNATVLNTLASTAAGRALSIVMTLDASLILCAGILTGVFLSSFYPSYERAVPHRTSLTQRFVQEFSPRTPSSNVSPSTAFSPPSSCTASQLPTPQLSRRPFLSRSVSSSTAPVEVVSALCPECTTLPQAFPFPPTDLPPLSQTVSRSPSSRPSSSSPSPLSSSPSTAHASPELLDPPSSSRPSPCPSPSPSSSATASSPLKPSGTSPPTPSSSSPSCSA